jgi:hypothetical protein
MERFPAETRARQDGLALQGEGGRRLFGILVPVSHADGDHHRAATKKIP